MKNGRADPAQAIERGADIGEDLAGSVKLAPAQQHHRLQVQRRRLCFVGARGAGEVKRFQGALPTPGPRTAHVGQHGIGVQRIGQGGHVPPAARGDRPGPEVREPAVGAAADVEDGQRQQGAHPQRRGLRDGIENGFQPPAPFGEQAPSQPIPP